MCLSLGVIREHSSVVEHLPYKQAFHLVGNRAVRIWYRWTQPGWVYQTASRLLLPPDIEASPGAAATDSGGLGQHSARERDHA